MPEPLSPERLAEVDALKSDKDLLTGQLHASRAAVDRLSSLLLEVENAATEYADSTETGADLPDVVADMWERIKQLEELASERFVDRETLKAELADAQRLAAVCERQRDEAFALARSEVNRLTAERDGIKTTLHAVLLGRADVDRVLDAAGLGDGDPDGHLVEVVADEGAQAGVVRLLMGQRDEAREQVRRVLALADRLDSLYDDGYTVSDGDEGDGLLELPPGIQEGIREAPRRLPHLIRAAVQGDQPAEPTGHVYLSTGYPASTVDGEPAPAEGVGTKRITSRDVDCPTCEAAAGERCHGSAHSGRRHRSVDYHHARREAARAARSIVEAGGCRG